MTSTTTPAANDSRHWSYSIREFIHNEAFGGILLLVFAVIALIWANSPWHGSYVEFWHTPLTIGTPDYHITETLQHWINDGLMAIFFLVVGLEIKRELLVGELASLSQAAMPALAAVGGAIVPALIFVAINAGGDGQHGWGIPMATDIAFALGVLALLGSRVPIALKVFLTALAIVDDLLAVVVIAVFYTDSVNVSAIAGAVVVLAALIAANRLGVRSLLVYGMLGIGLWLFVFTSGIHATLAGVLLALAIPASTRINPEDFLSRAEVILGRFERQSLAQANVLVDSQFQETLQELEDTVNDVEAPLHNLEHALHPWVAYAIVPLFALANGGVRLDSSVGDALSNPITIGVVFGLVIGKQVGITLFAWLATRMGLATLPEGITWRHIYSMSWLGGIGFTMSIFVSDLAFGEGEHVTAAKIGILAASILAGLCGYVVLSRWGLRPPEGAPDSR